MLNPIFNTPTSKPKETPLQDLFSILVGYVKNGGLITGLYFIEQSEKIALNVYPLEDLSSYDAPVPSVTSEQEAVLTPSKTTFVFKTQK